jgi:hypothetical protein
MDLFIAWNYYRSVGDGVRDGRKDVQGRGKMLEKLIKK